MIVSHCQLQHPRWEVRLFSSFALSLLWGFWIAANAIAQPRSTPPQNAAASSLLPLQPAESNLQAPLQQAPLPPPTQYVDAPLPTQAAPILNQIGLVQQINAQQITVKAINGHAKTYALSPQMQSMPQMSKGTLVSYRLRRNQVAQLKLPIVKHVFEGVLIVVENDVLGLVSAAGERKYTKLNADKIASLKLTPGQTVRVMEFAGIRTKVICAPQTGQRSPIYLGEIEGALSNF